MDGRHVVDHSADQRMFERFKKEQKRKERIPPDKLTKLLQMMQMEIERLQADVVKLKGDVDHLQNKRCG